MRLTGHNDYLDVEHKAVDSQVSFQDSILKETIGDWAIRKIREGKGRKEISLYLDMMFLKIF